MVILDVPHMHQQTFYYCVPACQKMVLDYSVKHFNIKSSKVLSVKTIAKVTRTLKEGTAPEDCERVNELLRRARPPIKFETKYVQDFPDILAELKEEKPVIAWINMKDPPDQLWHAVVVKGFEPSTHTVFYDNPAETEENKTSSMTSSKFMKKWGWQAQMVKVLISSKGQSLIDIEWSQEGKNV